MKRRLVALTLLLIASVWAVSSHALAQSPNTQTMVTANQLYESGRYEQAAQAYLQLVDRGLRNGTVHYNLGNAYFKQSDLGRAILHYNRALAMDPRDDDIESNLEVVRGLTVDRFEGQGDPFLITLVKAPRTLLALNEIAIISLVLWFGLGGSVVLLALDAKRRLIWGRVSAVAGVLVSISVLILASALLVDRANQDAVVVASEVDVLSGPGGQYVAEFTLHSGAEVRLLDERGNWARLSLPGGQLQGWVEAETVERVDDA